MARSRKRVKRKSDIRNYQSPQTQKSPSSSRKRNAQPKIFKSETYSPPKRRRTSRYNLRESNSVILVDEIPCCQNPEQREKYTRLGLNSALFVGGSQRPKRKQSHISIITISSDDEETSEERTTEWINSLSQNYQTNVEPDVGNADKDQTFHPLCSSTPNTSGSVEEQTQTCKLSSASTSTGDKDHPDKVQEHRDSHLTSITEVARSHVGLEDQERLQSSQLSIRVPEVLPDPQTVTKYQGEQNEPELSRSFNSQEHSIVGDRDERSNKDNDNSNEVVNQCSESYFNFEPSFGSKSSSLFCKTLLDTASSISTNFIFGKPSATVNDAYSQVSPCQLSFNNPVDISTAVGFKFGSTALNDEQREQNVFDMPDKNISKKSNNQTETRSLTSDDPDLLFEQCSSRNST